MTADDIEVALPDILARFTGGAREITVTGTSIGACLEDLFSQFPVLRLHLFKEDGDRRPHVLIFYNDEDLRNLENLDTPVNKGGRIAILQAVSGG